MVVTRNQDGDSYAFPAKLVNTLVASIFGALLAVGGYMVRWNAADAAYRSTVDARLAAVEADANADDVIRLDERLRGLERAYSTHVGWAEAQERDLDDRLHEIERRVTDAIR